MQNRSMILEPIVLPPCSATSTFTANIRLVCSLRSAEKGSKVSNALNLPPPAKKLHLFIYQNAGATYQR
ncbi:hypothetical protein ES288_A13G132800v1 [Gossypium darwinii]|nr:hypothetical protein ES288_A13G132800v1 [Gossypium darwinii]TYH91748.1 hypothetical protein ES332_A13G135100v1 [Gossypium tomentosum]